MSSSQAFAIKRINKDLKEIQQNPVNGVGICLLDPNNPFELLVNIRIMEGRYQGLIFHILLILSEQYPCKPPKMLILPGQPYNNKFHHHIYEHYRIGFYKFCIDLLDEAYMNSNQIGTGWSPGYTFCTLLMQIQNFLADPDFHSENDELSDDCIRQIHEQVNKYTYTHEIGDKTFIHSTQNPYPPIQEIQQEVQMVNSQNTHQEQVKQRISCFMTTDNFIDNPKGIYGYPLYIQKDKFNRLSQKPIPEILSYEGFQSQLDQFGISSSSVNLNRQFKTGMGEAYNYFLPIFLNKDHYLTSKKILAESLAAISNANTFELQVIEVLPNLINKMLVALLNDSMHQSISAIEAYVHFTQLFHNLIEENAILKQEVDRRVRNMITSDRARCKQELGDIGEFMVIISASSYALTPLLLNVLYREYFARQIFWIPKNHNYYQLYLNSTSIYKKLEGVFQSALVSNKLLIFNIEAAKKFALDNEYLKKLAVERYSVISESEAEEFIKHTKNVIKNIDSHVKLMEHLGLGNLYPNEDSCFNLFKIAIYVSNTQKYSNFNIQLYNGQWSLQSLQIQGSNQQPIIKDSDLILKSEQIKLNKIKVQEEEQKRNDDDKSKMEEEIGSSSQDIKNQQLKTKSSKIRQVNEDNQSDDDIVIKKLKRN